MNAGMCRRCWMRQLGFQRRKYTFTPEIHEALRLAYAGDKEHLTAELDRLERRTGWPRLAFSREARRLALMAPRRMWTPEETAYMADRLGVVAIPTIARALGRSQEAVEAHAERLGMSRRVREGYTAQDLARVFGVNARRVQRWMDRGLLGRVRELAGHRVKEEAVVRFVRQYHGEYDLRRVDQIWFKAMVFGGQMER